MANVAQLVGNIQIQGAPQAVQSLQVVGQQFNTTASASTAALKQINAFGGVASQVLGGLGLATGIAGVTRELVSLGKESVDLAVRADTIGTAFEGATQRAGIASDDLLNKLNAAARGTATTAELEMSANKALALGVGANAQQVGDLLAIARQKGKDFGEDTTQAFNDISVGLGRLSPRILDNLGIILDEKQVYDDYAKSIGVATGKLSDQEKRQALVNKIIADNTDLIGKNASATLSAADKIAAAEAKIHAAQTRIGAALLPTIANFAGATAGIISGDLLPSGIRAREQALASSTTSLSAYIAARDKANAADLVSGDVSRVAAAALAIYMGALDQTTVAQLQDDAARKEAIEGYRESRQAIAATTAATIDYTDAIKGSRAQLDAAQASYARFADAVLPGTKAYGDELNRLQIEQTKADLAQEKFTAAGGELSRMLDPLQQQIDGEKASIADLADAMDVRTRSIRDQQDAVNALTDESKAYDDAVSSASTNLDQQQSRLDALTDVYDNLGEAIQSAKHDMDDLRHTQLVGEGALDDKLFAMEQRVKRQQLIIDQAKMRGAGKDELKALNEQLDRLRTAEDAARLAGELRYDQQHRALEQQGVPRDEKTFAEASHEIGQYQTGIDQLTEAQKAAGVAVQGAQMSVDQAKQSLMEATTVQRWHNDEVERAKAVLDDLNTSLDTLSRTYDDHKKQLAILDQAYQDAKEQALKPYQDQVDATRLAVDKLTKQHDIDFGKMEHDIDDFKKKQTELSYDDIVLGLQTWGGQVDILTQQYNNLILAQQTAAGIPGPPMGPPLPPGYTSGTAGNAGGYSAQGINKVLADAGSPLAGQGQFLIDMSLKYGIPVEVALAMFKVEGNYGKLGAANPNKNPGNLRGSPLEASNDGSFSQFATWQKGIEAFFKLLSEDPGKVGYRADVDRYKGGDMSALLDLIKTYAPAADNNNPAAYYQSVKDMIQMLLRIITSGSASAGAPGRTGIINNANPADDPMPSQAAVTSLFGPGATIGDTYDADRTGTTGRHYGVDIIMAPGTKLLSPVEGTVIKAGQGSKDFQGGVVMINDTRGREWYFGHVHDIQVRVGQVIAKGTLIAYIGVEGHTHVQIREGGVQLPIDPSAPIDQAATMPSGSGDYMPQGMDIGGPNFPVLAGQASATTARASGSRALAALIRWFESGFLSDSAVDVGTFTDAMKMLDSGMSIAGPNMDTLAGSMTNAGDAAATAAAGLDAATAALTGLIQSTSGVRGGTGTLGGPDAGEPAVTEGGGDPNETFAPRPGTNGGSHIGPGDGMSIGGPHYGDTIAASSGQGAGMGFGDGYGSGLNESLTGMEDATQATFDTLQADVIDPWKQSLNDYFGEAGFGFIGAASEGVSSAGGGLADTAGAVGGAAGGALSAGLQGSIGGALTAIGQVQAALNGLHDVTITITVNTVHTDDGNTGDSFDKILFRRGIKVG